MPYTVYVCKSLACFISDTYQLDNHRRDCEAITENANQHSIINNQYSVINHVDNGSVLYKVNNNVCDIDIVIPHLIEHSARL